MADDEPLPLPKVKDFTALKQDTDRFSDWIQDAEKLIAEEIKADRVTEPLTPEIVAPILKAHFTQHVLSAWKKPVWDGIFNALVKDCAENPAEAAVLIISVRGFAKDTAASAPAESAPATSEPAASARAVKAASKVKAALAAPKAAVRYPAARIASHRIASLRTAFSHDLPAPSQASATPRRGAAAASSPAAAPKSVSFTRIPLRPRSATHRTAPAHRRSPTSRASWTRLRARRRGSTKRGARPRRPRRRPRTLRTPMRLRLPQRRRSWLRLKRRPRRPRRLRRPRPWRLTPQDGLRRGARWG